MKKQIFYMTFIALLSGCNCYKGNILQIEELNPAKRNAMVVKNEM